MSTQDLGGVRARYPGSLREPLVVGGVATVGFFLALSQLEAPAWSWALPVLVGGALFALFLLLNPRAAVLREEGVEVERWILPARLLAFGAVAEAFWEFEIKTSLVGTGVVDSAVRLVEHSGRSLRLNPRAFVGSEELFARIGRLAVWPGHRRRLDDYREGKVVAFGQIALRPEGLGLGEFHCPWERLDRVEISPKVIVFLGKGLRRSFRLERIPYAFTFIHLLSRRGVTLSFFDGFVRTT
jgi:hypothetical protein